MAARVLIADDEAGMRLVIRKAMEKAGGLSLIGEAEDGATALRIFEEQRPDVVFLDVEMPEMSGVECAKRISDIDPKTVLIFATAHEEYMPEAFEVYAFDYLVKPFRLERLYQTLERIKERTQFTRPVNDISPDKNPEGLPENRDRSLPREGKEARERTVQPAKLMIRNRDGISLVGTEDIILIQREERSTVIYTAQDRYVTSEGMSELEEKLDSAVFFRCHKSYIINLGAVSKIYPYGRWTYIVKLKGLQKDALLTHDKYVELEKLFS